jgi:hypothetical protein
LITYERYGIMASEEKQEVFSELLGKPATLDERIYFLETRIRMENERKLRQQYTDEALISGVWKGFILGLVVGIGIWYYLNQEDKKGGLKGL